MVKLKQLLLFPFGATLLLGRANKKHAILISLVAPIFSILIGLLFLRLDNLEYAHINLTVGFVNLLPIAPLDGGMALKKIISEKNFRILSSLACLCLLILGIVLLFYTMYGFWLIVIALVSIKYKEEH